MAITRAKAEELREAAESMRDFLDDIATACYDLEAEEIKGEERTDAYDTLTSTVSEHLGDLEDLVKILRRHQG